jgi:DNA primase
MFMAIPEEFLSELRDRVDIVDVVGNYVRLKKSGSNFKALCPFHKEKTPSFMVSRERGIYKCFGCGASGNVFTFVMETQKVGFVEAVRTLASRAGMKVPALGAAGGGEKKFERLYEALEFVAQQNEGLLWSSKAGARARAYVESRGLSVQIAKEFRLGFADPSGTYVVRKAKGLRVWDGLMQVGAVYEGRGGPRDMFRNRLIFPIQNVSGRVIGFGGRSLDGSEPKYLNSRDSVVFRKGSLLYGLPQARRAFREAGGAILVEGYMDVLALHQAGLRNTVGSAGTALTADQASALKRFTDSAVIAFDGDEAGERASRRSLEILVAAGFDARVLTLERGSDPDSVVREKGPKAFTDMLSGAHDAVSYLARGHETGRMSDREGALRRVVSLLAVAPDPIRRQVLVQRASDLLGTPAEVLTDAMNSLRRGTAKWAGNEETAVEVESVPPLERELLKALLLAPELVGEVLERFDPELLRNQDARRLFEIIVDKWRSGREVTAVGLMDQAEEPGVRALIGEVAIEWEGEDSDAAKAVYDCVRRLKERNLRGQLETIKTKMRQKEATGLHAEVSHLAVQLQRVTDELKALAQGAS